MVYANESNIYTQAQHAEDLYLGESAYPSGAYDDQLARYASAYTAPSVVTNANLASLVHPYSGAYQVTTATTKATGDTASTGSEDLEMEVRVGNALKAGAYTIYSVGGPVGSYTASNYQSAYMDGLWLAEASKQTGKKFF
jgi:hypothetical protein